MLIVSNAMTVIETGCCPWAGRLLNVPGGFVTSAGREPLAVTSSKVVIRCCLPFSSNLKSFLLKLWTWVPDLSVTTAGTRTTTVSDLNLSMRSSLAWGDE